VPEQVEVADLTVVTCDGVRATVDITVWSPRLQRMVVGRVEAYLMLAGPGSSLCLTPGPHDEWEDEELRRLCEADASVRADIVEAIRYQRDLLRARD
jgi:hypothetical protein